MIMCLNELEAYAVYFAQGAANETIAFPSTGVLFCSHVENLAPIMIHVRGNKTPVKSGQYQNLIKLYNLWAARKKKEALDEQATKLLVESAGIQVGELPVAGATEPVKQKRRNK